MPNLQVTPRTDIYVWGRMIWLIDGQTTQDANMSLARMEVNPGAMSEPHRHANSHECIHVLEGVILETIEDKIYRLIEGETIFIPQGSSHFTQNVGDKLAVLMISYSEGIREYAPVNKA